MHTLKEEIIIIIYLVMYGIYLFSTLDIITILSDKFKKNINKIIIQIIYWLLQIYITFIFSYHLVDGYVPIYFVLFIYVGYYLYEKIFKKYFQKIIKIIFHVLKKILKFIIRIIKPFLYSKKVLLFVKKFFLHEKIIFKKLFNKKEKNKSSFQEDIPTEIDTINLKK